MKVIHNNNPFPFIIIENIYNNEELKLIWEELNFICYSHKLENPEDTGSAVDTQGNLLKNNKSIFLDDIYSDRKFSNILSVNRKIFDFSSEIFRSSESWFFRNLMSNMDTTLISYYESGGYYRKHIDASLATCLTWFYQEPKKFEGGNIILNYEDCNIEIEVENNKCLIFPSIIHHTVSDVIMNNNETNSKNGRFCMTQFLHLTKV